jgi:glutamate formiminotransferase/glutamate formiminotransferase/formiminotetrahydrofolate cyclodeaminase
MTAGVLEAVPNFSEGRNLGTVEAIVDAIRGAGATVLDWSADADHNRSVVTFVGPPDTVEEAALAGARVAIERIDLRTHDGVHPRIGAVDVLPFVPLLGLSRDDARAVAHRAGTRLAREVGVPVFFYADASTPPGRSLAELRRGGYEALVGHWPEDRTPDVLPDGWAHAGAHPTAGATCVGARPVLLAWNVLVRGLAVETAADIARSLRARNGGPDGVRALAFELSRRAGVQISMNLEDAETRSPMDVFRRLESALIAAGGEIVETEVIGMLPDRLVADAAADRLRLRGDVAPRMLSHALTRYLAERERAAGSLS